MMDTITTKNGTTLYYKVEYDKGGRSYFTGEYRERGYYLWMRRDPFCYALYGGGGLEVPNGDEKVLLKAVGRRSKKAQAEAEAMAPAKVAEVVAGYNERGIAL